MARIPILNSTISEIFQGLISNCKIYLLTNKEAKEIWKEYIDKSATSYFNLEDKSWLVKDEKHNLGDWIKAYNSGQYIEITKVLDKIGWKDEDDVCFCLSEVLCVKSCWVDFRLNWDKFIEIDDDCPIIINKSHRCEAIIFTPLGDINLIK